MSPSASSVAARLLVGAAVVAASVPADPTDLDLQPRPGGPGWLLWSVALLVIGGLGLFWHFVGRDDDEPPPPSTGER